MTNREPSHGQPTSDQRRKASNLRSKGKGLPRWIGYPGEAPAASRRFRPPVGRQKAEVA